MKENQLLRHLRLLNNWTQDDVAAKTSASRSKFSLLERSEEKLNSDVLNGVLSAYGLTEEEFRKLLTTFPDSSDPDMVIEATKTLPTDSIPNYEERQAEILKHEHLGKIFKSLRELHNLPLEQVANDLWSSSLFIENIENNINRPSKYAMKELSKYYSIPQDIADEIYASYASTLVQRITELSKLSKKPIRHICKEMGFSPGTFYTWADRSYPNPDSLSTIFNYFNATPSEFFDSDVPTEQIYKHWQEQPDSSVVNTKPSSEAKTEITDTVETTPLIQSDTGNEELKSTSSIPIKSTSLTPFERAKILRSIMNGFTTLSEDHNYTKEEVDDLTEWIQHQWTTTRQALQQ